MSRGNRVYLHILKWPGGKLSLPGLKSRVLSASLNRGAKLEFEQRGDSLTIRLPDSARDPVDTIVALTTAR